MQTKLTLRLDERTIQRAKLYAKQSGQSLSKAVSDYFSALQSEDRREVRWTPVVRSLKGVLAKRKTATRGDYRRYLEEKYL